jgi:hypothetical protein
MVDIDTKLRQEYYALTLPRNRRSVDLSGSERSKTIREYKKYVRSSEDMSSGVMMDSGSWLESFQSEKNLNIVSHLT